jgi:biopolymer transport protein ExbD
MTRGMKAMKPKWTVALVCMSLAMLGDVGCTCKAKSDPPLPTSTTAEAEALETITVPTSEEAGEDIIIEVEADGTYIIDGTDCDLEALDEKLQQIATEHKGEHVIILADKETEYEQIIKLLDLCKKHNTWNVSLAVRRQEAAGGAP